MSIRTPLIVSLVVIGAMLALTAWGWSLIPEHAKIAIHWSLDGRPNGFTPKTVGVFALPATAALISILLAFLPAIEPRSAHLMASRKLYLAGWYGSLGLFAATHVFIVVTAAGLHLDIGRWILVPLSIFVVVLGNYMGKSRSTFFVGLRLPWTLSSELAWEKGNRLTGRGWVATGVVMLLTLYFAGTTPAVIVSVIGLTLSFVGGAVVSYVYWRRDPERSNGSSFHE